jgi:hypothetical protein
MVDMLPQRVAETNGGGADDLAMAGDIRERYAGDDSLTAGRQIVKIPAALGLSCTPPRYHNGVLDRAEGFKEKCGEGRLAIGPQVANLPHKHAR